MLEWVQDQVVAVVNHLERIAEMLETISERLEGLEVHAQGVAEELRHIHNAIDRRP